MAQASMQGSGRRNHSVRRRLLGSASGTPLRALSGGLAAGIALAAGAQAGPVTVNPVQATTYNLTPAQNPITFGAGTMITAPNGSAIDGAAGTAWNVTNQGALKGNTNGIYFHVQSAVESAVTSWWQLGQLAA